MAVLPADHYVKDEARFAERLRAALAVAAEGHIVTLGIHPSRPRPATATSRSGRRSPAIPAAQPKPATR